MNEVTEAVQENPHLLDSDTLANLEINDLLDAKIEDIEEAAGFLTPPKGHYILDIPFCGIKEIGSGENTYNAIVVEFAVDITQGLENEEATPVKQGSKFSLSFSGGKGVQWFRTQFGHLSTELGASTVQDLMDKLTGCKVSSILGHRHNKDDKSIVYPRLSEISLA